MNNQWSVAGWGDKPVNAMLLQWFVNYNLPDGWYLTSAPIVTADWKADKAGDVWTVPLGGGVGKLFQTRRNTAARRPSDREASDQHPISRLRQRGKTGVRPGMAVTFPDTILVSQMTNGVRRREQQS